MCCFNFKKQSGHRKENEKCHPNSAIFSKPNKYQDSINIKRENLSKATLQCTLCQIWGLVFDQHEVLTGLD